jgi:sugar/nucleoside kinase (ribokinase family)
VRHGVAAIGLCSWDRFLVCADYPGPGEFAVVEQRLEQAGGTTGNTCAALARLGLPVMLASSVGDDPEGGWLIDALHTDGCDVTHITRKPGVSSDTGFIVVSGASGQRDRTIYWIKGAKPEAGDALPVDDMLAHEWVFLDITDARLRSFFLDLPAHRSPRTRLIGAMTYLIEMPPADGWQHALRLDVVVGNERELRTLTETESLGDAITRARADMVPSACRALYISRGARGALAIRPHGVEEVPAFDLNIVDTTGAGDAFAAGCLWGLLDRCDDTTILRRGNALGGLACRALGARTSLPTREEAEALLSAEATTR